MKAVQNYKHLSVLIRVRIIFLAFPVGVVGDVPSEKVRVLMQGRFDGPPQYHCCERGNRLVVIRARAGPGRLRGRVIIGSEPPGLGAQEVSRTQGHLAPGMAPKARSESSN